MPFLTISKVNAAVPSFEYLLRPNLRDPFYIILLPAGRSSIKGAGVKYLSGNMVAV